MAVVVEPLVHGGVTAGCFIPCLVNRDVVINDVAGFQIQVIGGYQLAALSVLADGYHLAVGIAYAAPFTSRLDGRVGMRADGHVDVSA